MTSSKDLAAITSSYSNEAKTPNPNSNTNDGRTTPTPTSEETPEFCKRIPNSDVIAAAKLTTHNELLKMGALMQEQKLHSEGSGAAVGNTTQDIFKIKTMSLAELYEYVENKLSKDHYSPEVIYLLFKIQSLLLEKEQLAQQLNRNETSNIAVKKELLVEKELVDDLKDSIKESTIELDSMEKENTVEIARMKTEMISLNANNKQLETRKELCERILCYLIPITIAIVSLFVNYCINTFKGYFA